MVNRLSTALVKGLMNKRLILSALTGCLKFNLLTAAKQHLTNEALNPLQNLTSCEATLNQSEGRLTSHTVALNPLPSRLTPYKT